ncbi:plastocyanin [Paenibacillus sp. V4I3]|uniref:cupredoxin domain-containing protein n=1 Tax=Paenibacillus sp. V4I3 TaxID=3042305 RepID=UPI0027833F54|nr:cupredoxin domain-containing protein [Paenibacillus sp. V4I3]MDQ0876587.1 plastocyanin [Paenibacillus sp. V4I3]
MMVAILSVVLTLLFTGYNVFYTYKRREKLTCMAGMMIAMTVGMMSSLALGVVLGVVLQHDLTLSTIIAVLFGMGAGYLTGKPISLMAALDGMMAGIMGGMMGAMLGVMLVVSDSIVLFIDVIFIFVMSVLIQLIDEETGKAKATNEGVNKPFFGSALTLFVGIVIVGVVLLFQYQGKVSSASQSLGLQPEAQTTSQENEGYQIATVDVKSNGYGPENIEVKAGVPTKIDFKTQSGISCTKHIVSHELGIDVDLKKGENFIDLNDLKPGTYRYTCGMYMYGGTITVK